MDRTFPELGLELHIQEMIVYMKNSFGTSHSLTTERINAMLTIKFIDDQHKKAEYIGLGEVGLPPKKKDVYYSNFKNVLAVFNDVCGYLDEYVNGKRNIDDLAEYDPFCGISGEYNFKKRSSGLPYGLKLLFYILERDVRVSVYTSAAISLFEISIFDIFSQILSLPWRSCFLSTNEVDCNVDGSKIFGTVSIGETLDETLRDADELTNMLSRVKVKLNADVENSRKVLSAVKKILKEKYVEYQLSVDANCSWDVSTAIEMLPVLKENGVSMCEQPMPSLVGRGEDVEHDEWKHVKHIYSQNGLEVLADESSMLVTSDASVERMSHYFTSISIKLEKTAGVRGALMAIEACRRCNIKLWASQMVAGRINTSAIAGLVHLCDSRGDVDCTLIVANSNPPVVGGTDVVSGGSIQFPSAHGLGVSLQ